MAITKKMTQTEKELLEHWKAMAQNSYYACIDSETLSQNITVQKLIQMQLENVSEIVNFEKLNEKTVQVGKEYIKILTIKL